MRAHSVADPVDMPPRPQRPESSYWQPISKYGLIALLLGTAWLIYLLATDEDGFLQIIDSFNLVIHEFGHPFFAIFGEEPGWWGGTWMELLVPAVIAFVFWWQRSALSFAFAGIWFFENFHYISVYIADAREQVLPLAGGGEHDWAWILGKHGLMEQDTAIAGVVETIGWIGMVAFAGFALITWLSQQRAAEPVAEAAPQPEVTPASRYVGPVAVPEQQAFVPPDPFAPQQPQARQAGQRPPG